MQEDWFKPTRLKELTHDGVVTLTQVLNRQHVLVQASSALSFAIRSPFWRDGEIDGLEDRVKDWMRHNVEVTTVQFFNFPPGHCENAPRVQHDIFYAAYFCATVLRGMSKPLVRQYVLLSCPRGCSN